eukprot:1147155-Pelagomonas_calceolata.AAC.13
MVRRGSKFDPSGRSRGKTCVHDTQKEVRLLKLNALHTGGHRAVATTSTPQRSWGKNCMYYKHRIGQEPRILVAQAHRS